MNSRSDIQNHHVITEIGAIVSYTFIALGILHIIFSWIHPWKTAEEIHASKPSVAWRSSIFRTESIIVPPIDKEEIKRVLAEYERISAQLLSNDLRDFTRCNSVSAVFKNTKPIVTPFVR